MDKLRARSLAEGGDMSNTYIISDTHLNHFGIDTYCDRLPNFTDLLIRNWQRTVQSDDLIIHCGDVFIGKPDGWKGVRKALKLETEPKK